MAAAFDPTVVSAPDGAGSVVAGRYRLDGVIGEGAMGTVYRVADLRTGASLAMKVLHAHVGMDERLARRFEREIEAGRRFGHPNLVPVLDDGNARELGRYLVMPLLDGTDLRAEIAGGVGLRRSLALVDQLLAALEHVHGLGLVHRDVKPENIRLVRDAAGDERLLLLDFGLVKPIGARPSEPRLTEHGRVFGTPWYMAPEQAMGERIDHRVDLYAVGALLFEMLSGAPPFDGSLASVLNQQINTPAPALPSWVPSAVARVVAQLLAKDAAARPQSAAEAAAALRSAVAGVAAQPTFVDAFTIGDAATSSAPPVSMLRSSRREGRFLAVSLAIAAAVTGAFGLASLGTTSKAQVVAADDAVAPAATPSVMPPSVVVPPAPPVVPAPPIAGRPVDPSPTVDAPTVVEPPPVVDTPPVVEPKPRKVVPGPSRPRVTPKMPDEPPPVRRLEAKKPPRAVSKLPGASTSTVTRDEDGRLHLRPRTS